MSESERKEGFIKYTTQDEISSLDYSAILVIREWQLKLPKDELNLIIDSMTEQMNHHLKYCLTRNK